MCLSASIAAVMLGVVAGNFALKAALLRASPIGSETHMWVYAAPALISAVQITVFGFIYEMLADALTEYENHRTSLSHNAALFKKLFVFYALNYFSGVNSE